MRGREVTNYGVSRSDSAELEPGPNITSADPRRLKACSEMVLVMALLSLVEAGLSGLLGVGLRRHLPGWYFFVPMAVTGLLGILLLVLARRVRKGRSFGAAAVILLLVAFEHVSMCAVAVYYMWSSWESLHPGIFGIMPTIFCLGAAGVALVGVRACLRLRAGGLGTHTEVKSVPLALVVLLSLLLGALCALCSWLLGEQLRNCVRDPGIDNVCGTVILGVFVLLGVTVEVPLLRLALTRDAEKRRFHSWELRLIKVAAWGGLAIALIAGLISRIFG